MKPVLKTLHHEAVPRALEKAEHYRLLNDPEQAESICHDVIAVEPDNVRAKRVLVLALTDQFASEGLSARAREARALAKSLADPYEQKYYTALVCEREARAYLAKDYPGSFAYEAFREAMQLFEQAEEIRPTGNDDAILRYNSCLRAILARKLAPRSEGPESPLE
jgi:hypothetical protein